MLSQRALLGSRRSERLARYMNQLVLRILYFEDLSVGMTETLSKTIASSDVVGFAHDLGIFLRALFAQRFYGCNSVLCEVAFKRVSGQCNDF